MKTWIGVFLLAAAVSAPAAELCLSNSLNSRNLSVECDGIGYNNEWIGYSTTGFPCRNSPSGICGGAGPLWTVSSSSNDPYQNSGPLSDPGVLYLWLVCSWTPTGLQAAEFDLLGIDVTVTGFTPMNGFLNAGTETRMLLAVGGCPNGSVAGRIDVSAAVAVDATSWGGIKSVYR